VRLNKAARYHYILHYQKKTESATVKKNIWHFSSNFQFFIQVLRIFLIRMQLVLDSKIKLFQFTIFNFECILICSNCFDRGC